MLAAAPSPETLALNRITFGARDVDVARVRADGLEAWVNEQLAPPSGDDPTLAAHLGSQTMRIRYNGQPATKGIPGWPDVNQLRPLNYATADITTLWNLVRNVELTVAANELERIQEELSAVTWIRNTHSRFQLREFMVDFWNNHFNVGRQSDTYAAASLPVYDAQVIRPRALGNFRDLLGAVAKSAAMLRYLNNDASTATHPNENYARELLELHTLGRGAYQGLGTTELDPMCAMGACSIAEGFTDQDIIQASRAFSGWTLEQGQQGPAGALPFTGQFVYNPVQHSTAMTRFMGLDFSNFNAPMQQGNAVLNLLVGHSATADFICTKLARRIFGDTPPPAVIARAKHAWLYNVNEPNQIALVLRAIILDGPEIRTAAPTKLRRPYERLIAFMRTTDTVVNAFDLAVTAASALGDSLFAWPTPEGRPDTNAQWLTTSANLYNWNLVLLILALPQIRTSLGAQTPADVSRSATLLVEYWVNRMVGYALSDEGMRALIDDATARGGVMAAYASGGALNIENGLRRLVALIASSPEFGLR